MSTDTYNPSAPVTSWMQFRNATPPVSKGSASVTGSSNQDYSFDQYYTPPKLTGSSSFGKESQGGGETGFNYNGISQGISAVSGLANTYLGFKNLSLSKKQFRFAKDSFNKNLANQANLVNQEIVDREVARLAASGQYNNESDLRERAQRNVTERGDVVSGTAI